MRGTTKFKPLLNFAFKTTFVVAALIWTSWLFQSGALTRELSARTAQFYRLRGKGEPARVQMAEIGRVRGVLSAIGLTPSSTRGDTAIFIVVGWRDSSSKVLSALHDKFVAHYSLPARLIVLPRDTEPAAAVGELLGIGSQWPRFYAVVRGQDSVLFRAGGEVSPDVHRQLLSRMYHLETNGGQPTVPTSLAEWQRRLERAEFSEQGSKLVSGRELLGTAERLVVMEAACSACRRREHVDLLIKHGFGDGSVVVIGTEEIADEMKARGERGRTIVSTSPSGFAPELGMVSRDVTAASPVVLEIRSGRVLRVSRLGTDSTYVGGVR